MIFIRSRFPLIILSAAILLLQSCASMFNFPKQRVTFHTGNPDATLIVDGKVIGTGDHIRTKLKRDMYTKQIKVEAPGYKSNYYCVMQKKKSPLYFFSIIPGAALFFIPTVSDVFKRSYDYSRNLNTPLTMKYQTKGEQMKFIETKNVSFDIKNDDMKHYKVKMRDLEKNLLKRKQEQDRKKKKEDGQRKKDPIERIIKASNTIFTDGLNTVLTQRGFTDTVNTVFKDNNNTLFLSPVIDNLNSIAVIPNNPRRHRFSCYYILESEITWNILNSYDEILATIKIPARSDEFTLDYYYEDAFNNKIINDLIQNSFNTLLTDPRMIPLLKREDPRPDTALSELIITKAVSLIENLEEAKNATVIVKPALGHGTGFAINNEGYLLTNYHVIAGEKASQLKAPQVITSEGETFQSTIIRTDPEHDIALLKIDHTFEKCFTLPALINYELGNEVSTIGTPRSIELGQSLTNGIISNELKTTTTDLIGLNMSVNGGNSGGPLFKENGKVLIGVISSKLIGQDVSGTAFCIPAYMIPAYLHISFK
jgi:S1-C subfamily serine protease